MDQKTTVERAKGAFKMNLNFKRSTNSRAPAITGVISTPENPDKSFEFAAFAQQENDKDTGEIKTYYIGPVTNASSMREALAQKKDYGTHFIAIRPNQFKTFSTLDDGTPNPAYEALSEEARAKEDAKPAWWGKWTRTRELPVLDAAAWDRDATRYGPWASGNTQHHMAKEQLQSAEPEQSTRRRMRSKDAEMSR